ncbi:MAG TPA: N-acetylglucosamine-6-phosphate deacetylase [Jatrophihabitans sp.]|nr:N-acetylglucosamine-6-phosphate deacetylase [Jatrophihabitans sp.]
MNWLLAAGAVVAGGTVHRPGWLEVAGGRVWAVGSGVPARPVDTDLGDAVVVPGFVDMHVHGGGGGSFTAGTAAEAQAVIAAHRAHGTTTMVGSLVSADPDPLAAQVAVLAELVESGDLAGVHLEGPWLSPTRSGAHAPGSLRAPEVPEVRRLLAAGRGAIRMVTIAPELPGAIDVIRLLTDCGVVVAIGHTEATYAQTKAAIAAGARVGTHLFNAMRPIHHHEPGPVVALADDPDVVVELVLDGVHLHPAMYPQVRRWVSPSRIALVTDAMAAAGMPDGAYSLGELAVTVDSGVATLAGTATIAGGTATADRLFQQALRHRFGGEDDTLLAAVQQTSSVPAKALGLGPRDLGPGSPADLVVLSPEMAVTSVMADGQWVRADSCSVPWSSMRLRTDAARAGSGPRR